MSCQARQHRADRGAATIYVMAMALICLVAAVVAVAIGEVAITRARASSAADLAALFYLAIVGSNQALSRPNNPPQTIANLVRHVRAPTQSLRPVGHG